jgi:phosphatidylinositol glycan class T
MMPLPDFSMPYNVITLTCSVIALFFGQVVGALTLRYGTNYAGGRRFVSKRPLAQMLNKLIENKLIQKLLG